MIYKFFNKIGDAIKTFKYYYLLNDNERLSLYRMLYWKNHHDGIPSKEFDLLKDDGWMIETDDNRFTWSNKAIDVNTMFTTILNGK